VSIRPHDPSSWTEERLFDWSVHGGWWATYANLHHLSAERRVYNFVRAINDDPCVMVSADQGDTWSLGGKLFTLAKVGYVNGYVKYASNGADRIDILTTEHHPRDYNTSIYHGYLTRGKLHRSDGTVVEGARFEQRGALQTELTKIFAAGSVWGGEVMTHAWTVDLRLDPSGSPVGIISCRANDAPDNSNFNDHRFFYARFVGNEWRVHQLARAGARLWNAEEDYTGLATIDPDDVNVVYVSTPIDPRHGRTLPRHEIFKGVTSDLGASWDWSAVTESSSVDNLRPMAVKCGVDTAVLWLRGKMDTSQRYQMAVVGVIVSRRKHIEFKIDPDDERGRELNRRDGNFNPATLQMWQLLLRERAWTHVLDVGANYGEMLVNVDLPATARVVAFEPNPRILPYLKWNLAEAGLPVEVIASAVSDQIGTAALLVNRGYSGTTRLADPDEAANGGWERVSVPTTTLTAMLGGAAAVQSMRVLVKIDVEGHEVPVLRGLMPALHDSAAFAALVEIKHLAREHLEWILEHFDVEIYDLHRGALERVAPSTADRLAHLLAGGRFYLQDAILRPKSDGR
jgi:FkbM family methyltransferase